ncbi:cyclic nucleotide-binding domain-containing protein [Lusitaniella coriacea]|uniref:cyclic nucleotide-binding domain-containing protein n=1 Tax=Lusitaniella coriacea TaxID=1983105 RepID=UPI003CF186DC
MQSEAFLQGILGASSLAFGALVGVYWKPNRAVSAAIMAFGSGALLSAIAFEITIPVYEQSGFLPLLIGFSIGGFLFASITTYIDQHGGFLRNPASSRRYLYQQRTEPSSDVLKRISHIEVMQGLPLNEQEALAKLLSPIQAFPGDTLCEEGTPGDYLYMIVEGEAEVRRGQKVLAILQPGEVFGEMSLLTGDPRSATIIARTTMELYELNKEHFGTVLSWSPHLAWALSRALARRLKATTDMRMQVESHLDRWRQQLMDQVNLDLLMQQDSMFMEDLVKQSAPLAIVVGTLIDNIPESIVIGLNVGNSHLSWSFLLAVFISNFPEALASADGMKRSGQPTVQILGLWMAIVGLSGFVAVAGYSLQGLAAPSAIALIQSIAGGAMLGMLASTMMPEAYELGGSSVTFSTIFGFLLGCLVSFQAM